MGRLQVSHGMGTNHPGTINGIQGCRSSAGIRMADRHVLHPLDIDHVVDMTIPVDRFGWHHNPMAKYRLRRSKWILHLIGELTLLDQAHGLEVLLRDFLCPGNEGIEIVS